MRRCIALLLLCLLTLQASWATVAALGSHEASPSSPHAAHQACLIDDVGAAELGGLAAPESGMDDGLEIALSADHHGCHGCSSILSIEPALPLLCLGAAAPALGVNPWWPDPPPRRLDDPDWRA